MQNAAARLLMSVRKHQHITPILATLHWLPAHYRVDFKLLILVYKVLHNLAPSYLTDLLHVHKPQRNLRSSNQMILDVPRTRLKLSGDRAFSVVAPKRWNSLPLYLRLLPTLGSFKKKLKLCLLELAFGLTHWLKVAFLLFYDVCFTCFLLHFFFVGDDVVSSCDGFLF